MPNKKYHKHYMYDDNSTEALGALGLLIGVRLRRVDIILNRCLASATEEYGLKPASLLCIALIVNSPGLSQIDLTLQTTNDKSTIVGVVDELEDLGWARREVSPTDRRRHSLYPTEKGKAALDFIARGLQVKQDKLLSGIDKKDLDYLSEFLNRMHDRCVEAIDVLDEPIGKIPRK